jgi:hypothetical protein
VSACRFPSRQTGQTVNLQRASLVSLINARCLFV